MANPHTPIRKVIVNSTPIELHKLLKFENLVESGGEAKLVITEGRVRVNGEVETRRGRKLYKGDIVTIGKTHLEIDAPA